MGNYTNLNNLKVPKDYEKKKRLAVKFVYHEFRKALVRKLSLTLLVLLRFLGDLHINDDSLDREGLVGNMENLASSYVVLVVHPFCVPPV